MKYLFSRSILFFLVVSSNDLLAQTNIKLSDVHLCCPTCQKAVELAVGSVAGANVQVDRDDKSVVVSAASDDVAQQALDAIAKAGFYGKSDHPSINMIPDIAEGNVSNAKMTGFHNCCGSCEYSIKSSLESVSGVKQAEITKRSCQITGNFNKKAGFDALNKAGFSAKITN